VIDALPLAGTTIRLRLPGTGSFLPVRLLKVDERGITVSAEPGYDRSFAPGKKVTIEWTEELAINVVDGTIAAAVEDEKRPRLAIRLSEEEVERIQRREHVRVHVELPLTLWTPRDGAKGQKGHTIDISGSGMLVTGKLELWPEDELEIELELPGEDEPIELMAVVARHVKPNAVGLRYTQILPGHRDRIIKELFRVQQEHLAARAGTRVVE
jgi:c-di-GMP-binding flagellar brake protein YcgR